MTARAGATENPVLRGAGSVGLAAFVVSSALADGAAAAPPVREREGERLSRPGFDLGAFAGILRPSPSHNLRADSTRHTRYELAPELGLRVAYLPVAYAAVEVEGAVLASRTEGDSSARLFAGRAHGFAQLPLGRVLPFVLVGCGALGADSATLGSDVDPALHFGFGFKFAMTRSASFRLDVRDTLSQRFDAEQGALAHHPELLAGVTLALEPRARPERRSGPTY